MIKQIFICLFFLMGLNACKKEHDVLLNKPPVAMAGTDIITVLPVDSVVVDGSSSYDPDGKIETYSWKQISNVQLANVANADKARANIGRLVQGVYLFELRVRDNSGAVSTDTISVTVQASTTPVKAIAGPDQNVLLPLNTATLDGSLSSGPSGVPISFTWRQIAGDQSKIHNNTSAKTLASFTKPGTYVYELQVSNLWANAYDTTIVIVSESESCNVTRSQATAQLTFLTKIPANVSAQRIVTVGTKIIMADYNEQTGAASNKLYIYDVSTNTLTQTQMSKARRDYAMIAVGNKLYIGGGLSYDDNYSLKEAFDLVDIYDVNLNTWTTAKLSAHRGMIAAAANGSKIYFAGGLRADGTMSRRVDIYDTQTNSWSTTEVQGTARAIHSAVSAGNKIYFIGGYSAWVDDMGWGYYQLSNANDNIDIYNQTTGQWSVEKMKSIRHGFAAISLDEKVYIAGGMVTSSPLEVITPDVEVINTISGARTNLCLSQPKLSLTGAVKDKSIIFGPGSSTGSNTFDVYNTISNSWSVGTASFSGSPIITSVNNQLYLLSGNDLYRLNF